MNRFNNPFTQEESLNINIDKLAQQMAITLKKLNENKQKISVSDKLEKLEISDNSLGSLHLPIKHIIINQRSRNIEDIKRQKTIKITPIARKKGKANSDYEGNNDDSQFIEQSNYKKITQYCKPNRIIYKVKNHKQQIQNSENQEQNEESEFASHPVIKAMKQKISKKEKAIQQLEFKVQNIRQRSKKTREQIKQKKQKQLKILIQFMNKKYKAKIYNQRLNQLKNNKQDQHSSKYAKKALQEVIQKIQLLKNQKSNKKSNKNRNLNLSLNEQTNLLQIYSQERQGYLTCWKKKLQSEKTILQKQTNKIPICQEINSVQQKYYSLPQSFRDQNQNGKIFQNYYLPLYCRLYYDIYYEIRALNLQKLTYDNLLVLSYPKIMRKEKRMELKTHIKQIHSKSIQLNDQFSNSIFTNNTVFTQIENLSQQVIVIGRSVWQEDLPTINLRHLLKRYEFFPQNIVKYIGKIILRAHEKIRRQIGIEGIIFPQNIIFNQRNDLKIDNWVFNEICRYPQYQQILIKDSKYLYLPPEYKVIIAGDVNKSSGMGIWTVGVIIYQMIFGKKPFYYEQNIDHEEFYIMTQLQFPAKPQIAQNCKELLKYMLCKSQNRINFEKALKHNYFDSKK